LEYQPSHESLKALVVFYGLFGSEGQNWDESVRGEENDWGQAQVKKKCLRNRRCLLQLQNHHHNHHHVAPYTMEVFHIAKHQEERQPTSLPKTHPQMIGRARLLVGNLVLGRD
jgi:hypothetical protein